ncbi:photosystem I subunit O [Raphidocelis subcapitata]|uniref:Photosystem I subunit O n=1 Tax=Raphidocelis subcapitata TaxID=307507 RepID=A0A2V0PQN9_9CHLO|nr:photosystem I subunit O [Raphidocelis subcapitata]|eukprot:GBF99827.1 photosystem I subunit O [Raphidocelis subcapitata]
MLRGLRRALGRRACVVNELSSSGRHAGTGGQAAAAGAQPSDATVHVFALDDDAQAQVQAPPADYSIRLRRDHAPDDSVRQRQAAAAARRAGCPGGGAAAAAGRVGALLSLSSLFEHRLQADAARALAALRQADALLEAAESAADDEAAPASPGAAAAAASSSPPGSDADAASCCSGSLAAARRAASARCGEVARVAAALARAGHTVVVRRVLHSKAYWSKSFDNAFIVALDYVAGAEYVVDPHFRELFHTGAMSANYRAVWESLPPVFVGLPCQLQPVVQALCEEVELSFLEAGRPCPPWRGWAATINRWMSDQFVDIPVPGPDAGEAEVAAFLERCSFGGGGATALSATPPASAAAAVSAGAGATPAACGRPPGGSLAPGLQPGAGATALQGRSAESGAKAGGGGAVARHRVDAPLRAQVGFAAPSESPPPPLWPPLPPPVLQLAPLPLPRPPEQQQQPQQPQQPQQLHGRLACPAVGAADFAAAPQRSAPALPPCRSVDEDFAVYYASSARSGDARMLEEGRACGGPLSSSGAASPASTFLDEEDSAGELEEGSPGEAALAGAADESQVHGGGWFGRAGRARAAAAQHQSLLTAKLQEAGALQRQQREQQQQVARPLGAQLVVPFAAAAASHLQAPLPLWVQQLVVAQQPVPLGSCASAAPPLAQTTYEHAASTASAAPAAADTSSRHQQRQQQQQHQRAPARAAATAGPAAAAAAAAAWRVAAARKAGGRQDLQPLIWVLHRPDSKLQMQSRAAVARRTPAGRVQRAAPARRAALVCRAAGAPYPGDWLKKDPLVIGLGFLGWTLPSTIGVSAFGGQSLFGLLTQSIGEEMAHWPVGPALSDKFWLYMITWHVGLFLTMTLAQIGVQARKQGYF